jgi:hypothetical protein
MTDSPFSIDTATARDVAAATPSATMVIASYGRAVIYRKPNGQKAHLTYKDTPASQRAAAKMLARVRAAGLDADLADATGTAQRDRPTRRYPDDIRAAVKAARELCAGTYPGPKQHSHVRAVIEAKLRHDVPDAPAMTTNLVVIASGVESVEALRAIARGEGDLEALAPLRPLGALMGQDAWCKGRKLAAILVAWAEQLQEATA